MVWMRSQLVIRASRDWPALIVRVEWGGVRIDEVFEACWQCWWQTARGSGWLVALLFYWNLQRFMGLYPPPPPPPPPPPSLVTLRMKAGVSDRSFHLELVRYKTEEFFII
jgi:hypothetical protein